MRWSLALPIAVFAAVLSLSPSVADAQGGGEEEARALFLAGREAFGDGRFAEALQHFGRSLELSGREVLANNIAACHDRLGNNEQAIEWYGRYLENFPEADRRPFIESRIRILQEAVDREEAALREADSQPAPQAAVTAEGAAEASDDGVPIPSVVLFGVAGAAGIGGIIAAVSTASSRSDLEDQCPGLVCDESLRGDVDGLSQTALVADILFGVSLAAAVGGVVTLLVDGGGSESEQLALEPLLGPNRAGVRLHADF